MPKSGIAMPGFWLFGLLLLSPRLLPSCPQSYGPPSSMTPGSSGPCRCCYTSASWSAVWLSPIRSLAYFRPVIAELAAATADGCLDYLRRKFRTSVRPPRPTFRKIRFLMTGNSLWYHRGVEEYPCAVDGAPHSQHAVPVTRFQQNEMPDCESVIVSDGNCALVAPFTRYSATRAPVSWIVNVVVNAAPSGCRGRITETEAVWFNRARSGFGAYAVAAGALGLLCAGCISERISTCMKLGSNVDAGRRGKPLRLRDLSDRGRGIVDLLLRGCRDRDIGFALGLSEATVKCHLANVRRNLAVHGRRIVQMRWWRERQKRSGIDFTSELDLRLPNMGGGPFQYSTQAGDSGFQSLRRMSLHRRAILNNNRRVFFRSQASADRPLMHQRPCEWPFPATPAGERGGSHAGAASSPGGAPTLTASRVGPQRSSLPR